MSKLLTLCCLLLVFSCSNKSYEITEIDGVKHIKNLSIKNKKVIHLTKENEYTHNLLAYPYCLDVDNLGNLYVLDYASNKIIKFDKSGNYISNFIERGTGPGEVNRINSFSIADDKILVIDTLKKSILYFDLNGNYIETKQLKNFSAHIRTNNKGYANLSFKMEKGEKMFLNIKANLTNGDNVYTLYENKHELTKNFVEFYHNPLFDLNNNYCVVSPKNELKTDVSVFDMSGKKVYSFSKNIIKENYSEKELEILNEIHKSLNFSSLSKLAIYGIQIDEQNRIWTIKLKDNDIWFEVYQDGIFQFETDKITLESIDIINLTRYIKISNYKIYISDVANSKVVGYKVN